MAVASLPLIIQDSLKFISSYLLSAAVVFGRSGDHQRGMRSDRRANIEAVLGVLLRSCCLQHKGIFCHFTRFWVRPISIPEMAAYLDICAKTVSRCLADLVDLGLIECKQIKRKNPETGQFEVSIGLRRFTEKFWQALGQFEKYKQAEKWASENGRRKFLCPFKAISLKLKNAAKHTGALVGNVLKKMEAAAEHELPLGQSMAKDWCSKILANIRQNK